VSANALHEEEALGRAYDLQLLGRLWRYVRPYRGQVALTLALVIPLFVLELAPAWIIKVGLDTVIAPVLSPAAQGPGLHEASSRFFAPPAGVPPLGWLAFLYLVAMFASAGLQFVHSIVMSWTGQSAMRDLRNDVFRHVQRLHLGFFDRYPVGRLVTRASNDVENVSEMFAAGIVALVTDVVKMIGIAAILLWVDVRLALVTFVVVPILGGAAIWFRLGVRNAFRATRVRIARINAMLQETITGMKVVQLFTREERNLRDFARLNAEHRDAWYTSIRYDSALFAAVEMAQGMSVALLIWYGTGVAAAGTLYLFIDWMRRFFLPLRDLSAKYSVMQSAMASCERIFQLLDTEPAIREPAGTGSLAAQREVPGPASPAGDTSRGEVEFRDVSFAYQDDDWVLQDVSFRVAPGERVAFVGATGAGKTSVIKLLTRLYEPQRGTILLDGVPISELPQAELRRRVALVLQDVFLFSGSVADNIRLGRPDLDDAAIERAARAVEAHRFIEKLPDGYATELRERGTNLSAGQRQLLSFARALAHGADVLVLDEATSSIDTETEALIQTALRRLWEGRTALVIAHRLSTIQDVDRIYVLHKGRIVEHGAHAELLAAGGVYHRLHRLQHPAEERGTTGSVAAR